MKGQINVEFLASALLYLLTIGSLLTVGSNSLPDFSEGADKASLNTEAYELTTKLLKEPGYSEAYGGTTNWDENPTTINKTIAFGLTSSSSDFNKVERDKLNNLESFNRNSFENFTYADFKNVTEAEHQYLMNFTWMPIFETERSFNRRLSEKLERDLIAYYPLEESSGPVKDYSGNGNNGSNEGAERNVKGIFNTNAFRYDNANNEYVDLGTQYSFNNWENMTISTWVKLDEKTDDHTAFGYGDGDIGLGYDEGNNEWYFYADENGSSDYKYGWSNTEAQANEWVHLVGRWNSTHITLFVNGEEKGSQTFNDPEDSNEQTAIGRNGEASNRYWPGKIDELRLYNRSLNERELNALMEAQSVIREPKNSQYQSSGNTVHYGRKKLNSKEYYVVQTSHGGMFDTAYISKSWNFTGREPKNTGDKFDIYNRNFTVSKFQNNPRNPGNILVTSKHLKEFGPNVDSDSTVIRFDRYAILDGEPMRMKVLAW